MAGNRRQNGLIYINGKPIRRSLINSTWTKTALECYKRGCNCRGCELVPPLDSEDWKCHIKDYVIAYIKMGYYPKESEIKHDNK